MMEPLRERGEPLRERSEPLRKKRHSSDVYVPYYADLLRRSVAQIGYADWLRNPRIRAPLNLA